MHDAGKPVRTRVPQGADREPRCERSAEAVASYLVDAANYPGGHAQAVYIPASEGEVAHVVKTFGSVLAVGARSSLTGGATPAGDVVLSTEALRDIEVLSSHRVRVGAGVQLAELQEVLRARDLYYPPIPTYDGATVGGTVATNAAGAATFKYGTTRDWIEAITVVLAGGEALDIRRGDHVALAPQEGRAAGGKQYFEIEFSSGRIARVPVPTYRMPDVPKRSAGYFAEPGMDLVDLFIGAEGTLGVVTSVELRVVPGRPSWFAALVPVGDDTAAIELVASLREASRRTWSGGDDGVDVAAVEYMDRRCLELLREDGTDSQRGVALAPDAGAAVIVQAELEQGTTREQAFDQIAAFDDGRIDTPLQRLCLLLARRGLLATAVPVLPGEEERRTALFRIREAVPEAVNRRVREAQRSVDPSISKSGGDVIVPFDAFGDALAEYRRILEARGLDYAIWGHISDGNVHPNVIARSAEEMRAARGAQLEIGMAAIALGGCPMSEHGVGRNAVKQELLTRLYGADGIGEMRAVKRALDPNGVLARGVLFRGSERG